MRRHLAALALLTLAALPAIAAAAPEAPTSGIRRRADLAIRDPFIVPVAATGEYYLYTSSQREAPAPDGAKGVVVWKSKDLNNWSGPTRVFSVPANSWAEVKGSVWAPEVHFCNGRYYLFVTLANNQARFLDQPGRPPLHTRATQIFAADSPEGPFLPLAKPPITPAEWMALDGTLGIEDGRPFMVFCHEWHQTIDGTFELVELAPDLSRAVSRPQTLFAASEIPWSRDLKSIGMGKTGGFVSDGCFLFRTKTGTLLMLTSSFGETKYCLGVSRSTTGRLAGPWVHEEKPLYSADGGHGMIFRTFDHRLVLTLHSPNDTARCRLFELEDTGDSLRILAELPF